MTKKNCPVCNSLAEISIVTDGTFYSCPVCGRYEIQYQDWNILKNSRLASYLYYNRFAVDDFAEYRYHTTIPKETCDEYRKQFDEGNYANGRPVHMDPDILESWYPKSFSERIDSILLCLNRKAKHIGAVINLGYLESFSLLLVDRKEKCDDSNSSDYGKIVLRDEDACEQEARYMLDYLSESMLIRYTDGPSEDDAFEVTIAPAGYSRIDELLKNTSNGRNVLVAMKFGNDTKPLREAIRQGIKDADYHAVFIDEVQHNDYITPELLKYIRDSKFVVVDLTHQNNGAYFEEGYAMGLGKPVIQLCKKDTKLHFDIAQKNTIMWEMEDEIPIRLTNRIKATID